MEASSLPEILEGISHSLRLMAPEIFLGLASLFIIVAGLIRKSNTGFHHALAAGVFLIAGITAAIQLSAPPAEIFSGMFRTGNTFGDFFKVLFSLSGLITVGMTWRNSRPRCAPWASRCAASR